MEAHPNTSPAFLSNFWAFHHPTDLDVDPLGETELAPENGRLSSSMKSVAVATAKAPKSPVIAPIMSREPVDIRRSGRNTHPRKASYLFDTHVTPPVQLLQLIT
jgi:hypothetical protein